MKVARLDDVNHDALAAEKKRESLSSTAVEKLKKLQATGDTETAHSDADGVLCDLLKALGYEAVVEEWEKVDKWYA